MAPQSGFPRLSSGGRPQLLPSLFLSTKAKGASNTTLAPQRQLSLLLQELSLTDYAWASNEPRAGPDLDPAITAAFGPWFFWGEGNGKGASGKKKNKEWTDALGTGLG